MICELMEVQLCEASFWVCLKMFHLCETSYWVFLKLYLCFWQVQALKIEKELNFTSLLR